MATSSHHHVFLLLIVVCSWGLSVSGQGLSKECSNNFAKLSTCLSFATGKAEVPTKECCGSVKEIKDSDPKCLCSIMQQTHGSSGEIKSMGIQEAKLLQLPSACQLTGPGINQCPKLLGLAPGSPDAAIFTSNSSSSSPAPTTPVATSAMPAKSTTESHGTKQAPAPIIAMPIMLFFFTLF